MNLQHNLQRIQNQRTNKRKKKQAQPRFRKRQPLTAAFFLPFLSLSLLVLPFGKGEAQATLLEVSIGNSISTFQNYTVKDELGTSLYREDTFENTKDFNDFAARASYGSLGVFTKAKTKGVQASDWAYSTAGFRVEDLVISSATPDPINVKIQLQVDGDFLAYGSQPYINTATRFELYAGLDNTFGGFQAGGTFGNSNTGLITYYAKSDPTANGILSTHIPVSTGDFTGAINSMVTIYETNIPVNVPINFEVFAKSYVATSTDHVSSGEVDFLNTISLPSGPVFQFFNASGEALVGVTANSETAGIVDNVWNQTTAPVPEPTTMLLLGTGLIGLAGARRRFKK